MARTERLAKAMVIAGLAAALSPGCSNPGDDGTVASATDFIGVWASTDGTLHQSCSDGSERDYGFSLYYLLFATGTSTPLQVSGTNEHGTVPPPEAACWYRYDLVGRQAILADGPQSCGDLESYTEDVFTLSLDGQTLDEVAVVATPAWATPACTSYLAYRFQRTTP